MLKRMINSKLITTVVHSFSSNSIGAINGFLSVDFGQLNSKFLRDFVFFPTLSRFVLFLIKSNKSSKFFKFNCQFKIFHETLSLVNFSSPPTFFAGNDGLDLVVTLVSNESCMSVLLSFMGL